jgi:hypothetical protein
MTFTASGNPVPANHHSTIPSSIHNIVIHLLELTVIAVVQAHLSEEFLTGIKYLESVRPHPVINL